MQREPKLLHLTSISVMDWASDDSSLNKADLEKVFRYRPQKTTVVKILTNQHGPVLWSNETPAEWQSWLENCTPSIYKDSGLVLIIARKPGTATKCFGGVGRSLPSLQSLGSNHEAFAEKVPSFGSLDKEALPTSHGISDGENQVDLPDVPKGAKREVRELPFDQNTFRDICDRFFVHSSIARVISRADVPVFSRSYVTMKLGDSDSVGHSAIVYNCRSSNTWAEDMALTATHFPQSNLTFAVLFGCNAEVERNVINRLSRATDHASFPLLLPGIFAELERDRMAKVVTETVNAIEGAIFELGTGNPVEGEEVLEEDKIDMRHSRRSAWLNTTFLRNSLRAWKGQLRKMADHVIEVSSLHQGQLLGGAYGKPRGEEEHEKNELAMNRTGSMIHDRLHVLMEDFEDRIQECTMSVEGMTIATQWAQGDTNVDIATASGRDSRQMRSIALLTMIFLPGTFFATLFSMTFFNWYPNDSQTSVVSGYIWIYFLVTGVFTASTLLLWWYFLSSRRKKYRSCSFATYLLRV
ncbi:hypothetical protein BDP55DRAFT_687103 [Colletotrichum godetiae]|uniref:Uncharacterized protein n=1 Tax=Colletotrichum godetiae TaxID=1209918 RepID=A0AAJ0A5U2_9PEZI|nr:uncharacterized protein BDP55DRAFT_687103 [Colletotrichum godetiae]KAK1657020.1 hypothetical protein BDP55DRAFT_687103 [Colletotrichum godetiae]